ncbi:SUKH-3 domain-containing protein [Plantactinospora sp. GCM10030261]|uniref:SUKH-3 domain-containing protein n=1 Tax=Plantactinospora sp. GCM10030261 TaxID=3273420 RepID=UPI00361239AB
MFDEAPGKADTVIAPWGSLDDPDTRRRVLDYLTGATLVRTSSTYGRDMIATERHFAVRAEYRTDGRWIWPHAAAYYLDQHAIAPEPELLQHILAAQRPPAVPEDLLDAARGALKEYLADRDEREAEWWRQSGLLPTGDESRFSPEVNRMLLDMGWRCGRDIREKVDDWLRRRSPIYNDYDADDWEPYALVPTALEFMYEFGGLGHSGGVPGKAQATIFFAIYPVTGDENLDAWAGRILQIGDREDVRLCQVGEVERGQGALAVDEHGHVYIAGPANFHVADTVEEGLARLLEGGPGIAEI